MPLFLLMKSYVSGHTRRDGRTQKRVWVRPYYNRRSRHDYLATPFSNDTSIHYTKETLSNLHRNPLASRVVGERRIDKLVKFIPTGLTPASTDYFADLRVFEHMSKEETRFHDFTDYPAEHVSLLDIVVRDREHKGAEGFLGKRQVTFSVVENEKGEKEFEIGVKMNYLAPSLHPQEIAHEIQTRFYREIEEAANILKRPIRLRITVPKRAAAVYAYSGFQFSSDEERQRFAQQAIRALEESGYDRLVARIRHLNRIKARPRQFFEALEGEPGAWSAVNNLTWHAATYIHPRVPRIKRRARPVAER